ncbi:hypothetical protein BESB_082500 [Besnoitia besnoiti]|uniref:Regulator of chromosome condensation (RCC1) repeat-containing protein n=1 Tax=Besnoitia besnoiti TaxID=94643 RepID=A0A2A9M9Q6_BESBE|nr:hypothetical protein BESB_082500 [Besnoitia besnoiti]PFH33051.1 hypothetical protein BESB_082500 [Besnoitia besnoiti]
MGHCTSKSAGGGMRRSSFSGQLYTSFRGEEDGRRFSVASSPDRGDAGADDSECLLSLPPKLLHNLEVSLWSPLLFNASGYHRRMYWFADFGDPVAPQLIGQHVEARWDALKHDLRAQSQAECVRRLPELPTLAWFHLLLFYEARASELLQSLTEALVTNAWTPGARKGETLQDAKRGDDEDAEAPSQAEDWPTPSLSPVNELASSGLSAHASDAGSDADRGCTRGASDSGSSPVSLRPPSAKRSGRGQEGDAAAESAPSRKIAFLSNAFVRWSEALHRSYLLSQHLSWLTSIVAHALTTPELRKALALALYAYYTEERPPLGLRQPRDEAQIDPVTRAALREIIRDQIDEGAEAGAGQADDFGEEGRAAAGSELYRKRSSRIFHRDGARLDTYGYLGLMRVADAVKEYVESKRIDSDALQLDVLDWALAGFEYKGVVFVLVHDQAFWSAVRAEFRCCQVLRAAARPTDVHLAAKCGRLCAVEGFGLRVLASPLIPHCIERFHYPLPYTVAGDVMLKVFNSIHKGKPAKYAVRVPNPQNKLSLYAPRFQTLAPESTAYSAVTEEMMSLGPPHLWRMLVASAPASTPTPFSSAAPNLSVLSSLSRSLRGDAHSLGEARARRLISFPSVYRRPSAPLPVDCEAGRPPEIYRKLYPFLVAALHDARNGISRRFLYDAWVLWRAAPKPRRGELGRLIVEAAAAASGPGKRESFPRRARESGRRSRAAAALGDSSAEGEARREGYSHSHRTSLVNKTKLGIGKGEGEPLTIVKEYDPRPTEGEGLANNPQYALIFDGVSWTRPSIVPVENGDMEPVLRLAASLFGCSQNDLLPYQPLDETIGVEKDDFIWAFGHQCSIWTLAKGPNTGCVPDIRSAGRAPKVGSTSDYFQVDTIGRVAPPLEDSVSSRGKSALRMCLPWASAKFVISLAPRAVPIRPENYLLFPLPTSEEDEAKGSAGAAGPALFPSLPSIARRASALSGGSRRPADRLPASRDAAESPERLADADCPLARASLPASPYFAQSVHRRLLAVLRQRVPFLRHGGHLRKIVHHFGSNVGLTLWLLWAELDLHVHHRILLEDAESEAREAAAARAAHTPRGGGVDSPRLHEADAAGRRPRGSRGVAWSSGGGRGGGGLRMEEALLLQQADQLVRELVACEIVATAVKRVVRMYTSELPDRPLPFVYAIEALLPVLFRPDLWWRQVEKMLPDERRNMRHHESCLMVALWLSILEGTQVVAMRPWEVVSTFNSILRTARSVPTTLAHCLMHALNVEFSSSFLYVISMVPEAEAEDGFSRVHALFLRDQHMRRARRLAEEVEEGDRQRRGEQSTRAVAGLLHGRGRSRKGDAGRDAERKRLAAAEDASDTDDERALVEAAKSSAVRSLNSCIMSQDADSLFDAFDAEAETELQERKAKLVDASVDSVDAATRRLLSLDVSDLYQVSSMLVRAHFKQLELLPTEEAISTELLLLHGLREHITPESLLLEMRRKTVACARRLSEAVAPPPSEELLSLGAAPQASAEGRLRGSAWPAAPTIFAPRQEKFDSFIGRLLASNLSYAHDSGMAQYRLLVFRRFLEEDEHARRSDRGSTGWWMGRKASGALQSLPHRGSVLGLVRQFTSLLTVGDAAAAVPASCGGGGAQGGEAPGRDGRLKGRRERLPEVLDAVVRQRKAEKVDKPLPGWQRAASAFAGAAAAADRERKEMQTFEVRIKQNLDMATDLDLSKYLTPMQLGMLDGCRLLRTLSETGSSSRLTTLYAGHTLLTWTLILLSQGGVEEEGRRLLLARCVGDFAAVEDATRSLFSSEIEIAISILALRGLVNLWHGFLDAAKDFFIEALLLLFDAWGDPRLYGGRGHPFLLFLSWTLCQIAYLTRDWALLRAYAGIFRATRLFYPSCPFSLAAPASPPAEGARRAAETTGEEGQARQAPPRSGAADPPTAGEACPDADGDWGVQAREAYVAWVRDGPTAGARSDSREQVQVDAFIRGTLLYNFALISQDLVAWMAATHPANGTTFSQTVDIRKTKQALQVTRFASRSGGQVQAELATDARHTCGVDMELINYDGGGQVPQAALSGRLLSLGSNVAGQLGLGLPTAPATAAGGPASTQASPAGGASAAGQAGAEGELTAAGLGAANHATEEGTADDAQKNRDGTPKTEPGRRCADDAAQRGVDVWWTPQPSVVSALKDAPVMCCAAGFFHSAAVDVAGRLWAWGTNAEGQIGASYHHYADVVRGARLEELSAFSWNTLESDMQDTPDLDVEQFALFTSADVGGCEAPRPGRGGEDSGRQARGTDLPPAHGGPDTDENAAPGDAEAEKRAEGARWRASLFARTDGSRKKRHKGEGENDEDEEGQTARDSAQQTRLSAALENQSLTAGQKRHAVTAAIPTLVSVPGEPAARFKQVACGRDFTLALTTEGHVFAWGSNAFGCLGASDFRSRSRPQAIDSAAFSVAVAQFRGFEDDARIEIEPAKITEIRCGPDQCAALSEEQNLWVWGRGTSGELGLPPAYLAMLWHRPLSQSLGSTTSVVEADPDTWLPGPNSLQSSLAARPNTGAGLDEEHSPPRNPKALERRRTSGEKDEDVFHVWQSQGAKGLTGYSAKRKMEQQAWYRRLTQSVQGSPRRNGCVATPTRLRVLQFGSLEHFQEKMEQWNLRGEWQEKALSLVSLRRGEAGTDDLVATLPDELLHEVPTPSEEVLFLDIAFGASHTVCVDISNNLLTWGWDGDGQLALARDGEAREVRSETALASWKAERAKDGRRRDALKKEKGALLAAAGAGRGADCDDAPSCRATPCFHGCRLLEGKRAKAIAAGGNVSAAVDYDGALWVWGSNADGLLGAPRDQLARTSEPQKINLLRLKATGACISPDGRRLAVCTDTGEVLTWGRERFGSLGLASVPPLRSASADGEVETLQLDPARVPLLQGYFVSTVSLGVFHTLLLSGDPAAADAPWAASGGGAGPLAVGRPPTVDGAHRRRRPLQDFLATPIAAQRRRESRRASPSEAAAAPQPREKKNSIYMEQLNGEANVEYPRDMDADALAPGPLLESHAAPASACLAAFNTQPPAPHPSLERERVRK